MRKARMTAIRIQTHFQRTCILISIALVMYIEKNYFLINCIFPTVVISLAKTNVSMYILIEHGIWGEWGKWEFWKCNPAKQCLKKRRQPCIGTNPCDGKEPQQSECKIDEYSYFLVHMKLFDLFIYMC